MQLSSYDISNIYQIMQGMGDWFSAKLLRLMADADEENIRKLGSAYPEVFVQFCNWKYGGVPSRYGSITSVYEVMKKQAGILWIGQNGMKYMTLTMTSGRDY